MPNRDISHLRQDYRAAELDINSVSENPFEQFDKWLHEAMKSDAREPNAMALATVGEDGKPSCRIVLLKQLTKQGLIFYTNYKSNKGREILNHPQVAVTFFWELLERQVRVEGLAKKLSAEQSDKYFESRPDDSKVGAIASPQSEVVESRELLEKRFADAAKKPLKRPEHWGGIIIQPEMFEFWQGRPSRMHDRIRYKKSGDNWQRLRLAP